MEKRTYSGVTRTDVDKIRSGIGKFGIKMPKGDDVEVKGPLGVKMRFEFDEAEKSSRSHFWTSRVLFPPLRSGLLSK